MEENDVDLSTCRKCEKIEVRKHDGFYPDGRNKRFVDGTGRLWCGRICANCQRDKVKIQIKEKRAKVKKGL